MSYLEENLGELKSRLASILFSSVSGLSLAILTAANGENIHACPFYYSNYVAVGEAYSSLEAKPFETL